MFQILKVILEPNPFSTNVEYTHIYLFVRNRIGKLEFKQTKKGLGT